MRYEVIPVAGTDTQHPQVWVYRDGVQWLTTPMSETEAEVIVAALNAHFSPLVANPRRSK